MIVAQRILAGQDHHQPVQAQGDAAVGRERRSAGRPAGSRICPGFPGGHPEHVEHLLLQVGAMDPDGAAAQFHAVEHHVIGLGQRGGRVGEIRPLRGSEGVMAGHVALFFLVEVEHGEIHHPQEVVAFVIAQALAPGEVKPQDAQLRC